MRRLPLTAILGALALLAACRSVPLGRVDVVGEFDMTPGTCDAEVEFEFIQAGGVVASGTISSDATGFGGDFDDDGMNYGAPTRIHLTVVSGGNPCPPELRAGREYWWPDANSLGTLPPAGDDRYRVDVDDFRELQVTPGQVRAP